MPEFKDSLAHYAGKPFEEQLETEKVIFNQFQNFDFLQYRESRLKHLTKINTDRSLDALISYVRFFQPNIGVFAGDRKSVV